MSPPIYIIMTHLLREIFHVCALIAKIVSCWYGWCYTAALDIWTSLEKNIAASSSEGAKQSRGNMHSMFINLSAKFHNNQSVDYWCCYRLLIFNKTCITALLYGCESWVIEKGMEKINSSATSCSRTMLGIKHTDKTSNAEVYTRVKSKPLFNSMIHHQLTFLGHVLRLLKEEPAKQYALHIS